jgi:thiamine pyrophosphate-dependent acetolactate synthase large subunit-like protein
MNDGTEVVVKRIATDLLVERLADWGVDTVFGLPGDGINGIMEGLRRHADRIRFVLVHHEEAAAFMAAGYAKTTGRLGVCLAASGPGGIHLLNGLYDAKLDHQPVLAITGMQETQLLGTGYQQAPGHIDAEGDRQRPSPGDQHEHAEELRQQLPNTVARQRAVARAIADHLSLRPGRRPSSVRPNIVVRGT